jgi:hypothetical protein
MSEEKRTKVTAKDIEEQVKGIVEYTEKINALVITMPDCTAKTSYMNSIENLEKKNEKFSKVREKFTPEEKEVMKNALKTFREGKTQSSEKENDAFSADMEKVKGKKKGKNS